MEDYFHESDPAIGRHVESDPFGTTAANEDPDGDGIPLRYYPRFPGQFYDASSELHYNYFRDYDPAIGRYVESDPIGIDGGINIYLYAEANPLMYFDEQGLCPGTFVTEWTRSRATYESRSPLPGQCEFFQDRWRLLGLLSATSGACDCGEAVTCTYLVIWEQWQRRRPANCRSRKAKDAWGPWHDHFTRSWGEFSIPFDCKSGQLDVSGHKMKFGS